MKITYEIPPIVFKSSDKDYLITIGGFRAAVDRKFVEKMLNDCRVALKESNDDNYTEFKVVEENETTEKQPDIQQGGGE